jgi:hypothetical protein
MSFHIIASTGRTATTFLAAALDRLDGVAATHEGYRGSVKDCEPLLPLVNLENAAAYASEAVARQSVVKLRSSEIITTAIKNSGAANLIDVAYYNAMIGPEILAQHSEARMIGIIRGCENFVRSATAMEGEDPLPVGWPAPDKPLTDREKFIGMGRIRPGRKSLDKAAWATWGALRRNIWLWRETNLRLCAAKEQFGERVALLRFETFQTEPEVFWSFCAGFLGLPDAARQQPTAPKKMINKKSSGYQIGAAESWSPEAQAALAQAQHLIENTSKYAI